MIEEQKAMPPTCKVNRLAQDIMRGPKEARYQITHAIRLLNKYSYVKDMSMSEVLEALRLIIEKEI